MKSLLLIILLTVGTSINGTNVNISFTQQHSSLAPKYIKSRKHQDQLKTIETDHELITGEQNARFARIQDNNKNDDDSTADYRSEDVPNDERSEFVSSPQKSFYNSNQVNHRNHGHLKKISPQDKQNMEFERYIQNYHSGPTVETVYESAKPAVQNTLSTSSVNEESQRVVATKQHTSNIAKFERQIALPARMDNDQTTTDHHTIQTSDSSSLPLPSPPISTLSSSSASVPSGSVDSRNINNFKVNLNRNHVSTSKDGFNFDHSYNKPNYNDPTFKYNEEHSDVHFYNQFPPSVEESQSGYGDFYGTNYNRQQVTEQRPVVTKTIQIAQPAIKAKKYEVRHPAIQKEFYDIEERVVIKPAGTVVVELERPSAKILKEETTLPLGHPHPAVAAAYMPNRNTPTFSNIIYSNAGSSSSSSHSNNQYTPHQTYNNKNSPDHRSVISASTIGSSVTTSPSFDQNSKEVIESNLNKQYNRENHYAVATNANAPKSQNREIVVLTDGHGNQRQVSTDQFIYSRDETDKAPSRPVYNQRSSLGYEDNLRTSSQANVTPQRSESREGFGFEAEYINNSGNNNFRKESKPARLREDSSVSQQQQLQPQPLIKHEHKIVLSPSQHNIYLSRNQEVPKMKFIEETAHVQEMKKPYLQDYRAPVVVYASTKENYEFPYSQRPEYQPKARVSAKVVQYRDSSPNIHSNVAENRVQYSAPYAQMRHNLDNEPYINEQQQQQQQQSQKGVTAQRKSGKLILEEKSAEDVKKSPEESTMERQTPQAHIEINIPNQSSHNKEKGIVVSSAIRPMLMDDGRKQMHKSKLEISVTNNGEPHEEKEEVSNENFSTNKQKNTDKNNDINENESEFLSNLKTKLDCDKSSSPVESENYEISPDYHKHRQQNFMRIVEDSGDVSKSSSSDASSSLESSAVQSNIQPHNIDVKVQSAAGQANPSGSRVIAATPASKESIPNESFHKRRIVVNHPFQTVREVVEHEPYTNYHEVQVNEPATPALYHSANYYRSY